MCIRELICCNLQKSRIIQFPHCFPCTQTLTTFYSLQVLAGEEHDKSLVIDSSPHLVSSESKDLYAVPNKKSARKEKARVDRDQLPEANTLYSIPNKLKKSARKEKTSKEQPSSAAYRHLRREEIHLGKRLGSGYADKITCKTLQCNWKTLSAYRSLRIESGR